MPTSTTSSGGSSTIESPPSARGPTRKPLSRAYDPRSLLERVGSYDSATVGSGTLESEVRFEYYDFGNLAKHGQSHAGSVGGSPPGMAYTHEDGFYNNTRLTAMTYPNGRIVQIGYGSTGGRDDLLSRIASVKIQGESHDAVTYRFAGPQSKTKSETEGNQRSGLVLPAT